MRRAYTKTLLRALATASLILATASMMLTPPIHVHAGFYTLVKEVIVGYSIASPAINVTQVAALGNSTVVLLGESSSGAYLIEARLSESGLSNVKAVQLLAPAAPRLIVENGSIYLLWSTASGGTILELDPRTLRPIKNITVYSEGLRLVGLAVNGSSLYLLLSSGTGPVLAKVSLSGSISWSIAVSSVSTGPWTSYSFSPSIIAVNGSSIYLAGVCSAYVEGPRGCVARVMANGTISWIDVFGYGKVLGVAVNGSRLYVLMRECDWSGIEESYVYLIALDTEGSVLWVDRIYSYAVAYEPRMVVTPSAIYVAGNNGSVYVARIGPSGVVENVSLLCNLGLCLGYLSALAATQSHIVLVGSTSAGQSNEVIYDLRFGAPSSVSVVRETSIYIARGSPSVSAWSPPTTIASASPIPSIVAPVSAALTPIYATVRFDVFVKQPSLSSPTMVITVAHTNSQSYAPNRTIVVSPRSTGVVDLGIEGTVITVSNKLAIYVPTSVLSYRVYSGLVTIVLRNKSVISIAAPRGLVQRIVAVFSNGTSRTLCGSPSECDALRDSLKTIVVDPSTIDIYLPPPTALGSSSALGGRASSMVIPLAITLVAVSALLWLATRFRRV